MKSPGEKHSGRLLIIGIVVGVLGLTAGPALAALSFSSTTISGDGAVVIDSPSTISIGTSTATGVTIGGSNTTVFLPGNIGTGVNIVNDSSTPFDDPTNLIQVYRESTDNFYQEPTNFEEDWTPSGPTDGSGTTLNENNIFYHGSVAAPGDLIGVESVIGSDASVPITSPVKDFDARRPPLDSATFAGGYTGFWCDNFAAAGLVSTNHIACFETTQQPTDYAIKIGGGISYFGGTTIMGGSPTVPSTTLQVAGASSTLRIGGTTGCIEVANSNGSAGINYVTFLDGVMTATTTKPSACQ